MKKLFFILACALLIPNASIAQSYDFSQGYIFQQKYVKRISLAQAEKITSSPGLFKPLLSWDWGRERELITDPRITRSGDRLTLEFSSKPPLILKNFSQETTRQAEGDLQYFKYLKSVPGYHIIGVEFGHDQPGFLLISESGLNIYFVDTY